MVRAYISLFFWFLTVLTLLMNFWLRGEVEDMVYKNSVLSKKLVRMMRWSEELKGRVGGGVRGNILSEVEEIARKYGIELESARPIQDRFEISARGIDSPSMIKFLVDLENSNSSKIIRIKIRKNFVDENLNDFEIVVAPE